MKIGIEGYKQKAMVIIFVIGSLVFSFQNCSRTKFIPPSKENESSFNSESSEFGEFIPPKYCLFNGVKYKENDTVDAFLVSAVPNGNVCPQEKRICKDGSFTGTYEFAQCTENAAAPVTLGVSHFPGNRNFKISSIGLSKSNGLCKIQYFKNNSLWVDLSAGFSCASDLSNANFSFPSDDNWTNNFNTVGVSLRLVYGNDNALVATVEQKLKCISTAGSNVPTPNIDENCNHIWDDTNSNPQTCKWHAPKAYGSSYSCANTQICGNGKTANFTSVIFQQASAFFSDSQCTSATMGGVVAISEGGSYPEQSGTVPTYSKQTGCMQHGPSPGTWYYYNTSGWTDSYCEYLYYEDPTYN